MYRRWILSSRLLFIVFLYVLSETVYYIREPTRDSNTLLEIIVFLYIQEYVVGRLTYQNFYRRWV